MAANGHPAPPLLDQLQSEVNRVLYQTGSVLKASNSESKSLPVAQLSVLRQMLPSSVDRFHHVLDQLEDELQMAKLVMRRDLAVAREKAGITVPTAVEPISGDTSQIQAEDMTVEQPKPESQVGDVEVKEDAFMIDVEPEKADQVEEKVGADEDEAKASGDAAVTDAKETEQPEKPSDEDPDSSAEQKSAETSLQINTDTKPAQSNTNDQQAEEDVQPDTGTFSNANDLDSLFGGPTSTGPVDGSTFNMDDGEEFDFDSFNTNNAGDNDNLSNLLPGLADYANTQSGGNDETDFDALFSTQMDANNGNDGSGENRDTTFDDLMNFGDFDTGNFGADGGKSGTNDDGDFDFNFD